MFFDNFTISYDIFLIYQYIVIHSITKNIIYNVHNCTRGIKQIEQLDCKVVQPKARDKNYLWRITWCYQKLLVPMYQIYSTQVVYIDESVKQFIDL